MTTLVDVAEWSDYARVPPPPNAATLLEAASGVVRTYCGWSISAETVEGQPRDGDGSSLLLLPTLRLTAVTAVVLAGRALVDGVDFDWSTAGIIQRLPYGRCWPHKKRAIVTSYRHGYVLVPAEIKAVVVALAARSATAPAGLVQQTVGAITYRWAEAASSFGPTDGEKAVLDRYRVS